MPKAPPAPDIWSVLGTPVNNLRAAEALLGLTPAAARLMAGVILASSPEADRLLDAMPNIVRSMAIATTNRPERNQGEVRGPIQWSETMAARAATAGDTQLYVCSVTARAYDTAENRVLAAALRAILNAARTVDRQGLSRRDSELARHVRYNAGVALRFSEHRTLSGMSRAPDRRDIRRTRTGVRHRVYQPALDVLARAARPIGPAHVGALAGPRVNAQHAILVQVVAAMHRRGVATHGLRPDQGILIGGPVAYVHPDTAARTENTPGIHVGRLVLDAPGGPQPNAADAHHIVVEDPADVERIVDTHDWS
jgi:hypothetical protein